MSDRSAGVPPVDTPAADDVVAVAELASTAAVLAPAKAQVEAVEFHPFSAGRKALLAATGNEFHRARQHVEAWMATPAYPPWWTRFHAATLADLDTAIAITKEPTPQSPPGRGTKGVGDLDALRKDRAAFAARSQPAAFADLTMREYGAICEECVPEFDLHVGALAFICCTDGDTLADLTTDPKAYRRAVVKWLDQFTSARASNIMKEALRRYYDENIGADFETIEPEDTDGAPDNPN